MKYDLFISHASEDKDSIALPLAARLEKLGLTVWIDETQLTIGDSLRRKIDRGLMDSSFGVVILSQAFFKKEWPNKELDGLVAREDGREKVILPVWHGVSQTEIRRLSPILADRVAISTNRGLEGVARAILHAIKRRGGSETLVQDIVAEKHNEVLGRLRTQMISSSSSRELRRNMFELEEYLSMYPHSVDARMLRDDMVLAVKRADRMERKAEYRERYRLEDDWNLKLSHHRSSCLYRLLIAIILAVVAYFIFALI